MRPFRWKRGRLVTSVEPHEAALLRQAVTEVRDLLGGDGPGDPGDRPGAEAGSAARDPVRDRLLPDGHRSDPELARDYRSLTEAGLRAEKVADAARLLDTVPEAGGAVELDEPAAQAWLRTINDVRLAIGVRLDVQEADDPLERAAQTGDDRWAVYSWLTAMQGLLVEALLTSPS